MNTDITDRLRSQMAQVRVQVPPGLARQAYLGYRRRRLAGRAAVAGGAAAVIAAGTAVAAGVTRAEPPIAAQTTAYVVSHLRSALAATRTIAFASTRTDAPGSADNGGVELTWAYGSRLRFLSESASGTKLQDTGFSEDRGKDATISVDYRSRTWYRAHNLDGLPVTPDLCGRTHIVGGVPMAGTATDLMSVIKSGLRCGVLRVSGHQVVDGVDAIKLTVDFKFAAPQIIWVNPRTFLPMQTVTYPGIYVAAAGTGVHGKPLRLVPVKEERTRLTWLSPTPANLARLTVPIPPGFRQING